MCESDIYLKKADLEELVAKDIVSIRPTDRGVLVEDILGNCRLIPGHIEVIDFLHHRTVVRGR
jgi:predicted RNA-binding protein